MTDQPITTTSTTAQPSINVTLFAYGDIKADTLTCHIDTIAHIVSNRLPVRLDAIREDALICRSRSRALAKFLASNCDVWIQLDHDIHFDPQDLFDLASIAHTHQAPVCVPYSKRALPPQPALRTLPDHPLPPSGTDTLTPIVAFATGFLAIPRACLAQSIPALCSDKIPHPYRISWCSDTLVPSFPSLFQPFPMPSDNGQVEYLSEDYAASIRLSLCGHKPLAWTRPRLGHVSNYHYRLD